MDTRDRGRDDVLIHASLCNSVVALLLRESTVSVATGWSWMSLKTYVVEVDGDARAVEGFSPLLLSRRSQFSLHRHNTTVLLLLLPAGARPRRCPVAPHRRATRWGGRGGERWLAPRRAQSWPGEVMVVRVADMNLSWPKLSRAVNSRWPSSSMADSRGVGHVLLCPAPYEAPHCRSTTVNIGDSFASHRWVCRATLPCVLVVALDNQLLHALQRPELCTVVVPTGAVALVCRPRPHALRGFDVLLPVEFDHRTTMAGRRLWAEMSSIGLGHWGLVVIFISDRLCRWPQNVDDVVLPTRGSAGRGASQHRWMLGGVQLVLANGRFSLLMVLILLFFASLWLSLELICYELIFQGNCLLA